MSNWSRKQLHSHKGSMFMALGDLNGDKMDDFIIAGGPDGKLKRKLIILIRSNKEGDPESTEIILDQPDCPMASAKDYFPKGVALMELDGDPSQKEIMIVPKMGDLWYAAFKGDPKKKENWKTVSIDMPGSETRRKMDNAYLGDLDGDGDLDIVTTEENGGWGVVWFENPQKK